MTAKLTIERIDVVSTEAQSDALPRSGHVVGVSADGWPLVIFAGVSEPITAATTIRMTSSELARAAGQREEVVLLFDQGRLDKPIIVGVIQKPGTTQLIELAELSKKHMSQVSADGETKVIEADEELVLKCGNASITLRRDGRVFIRGIDITSDADCTNRIRGGAVEIN